MISFFDKLLWLSYKEATSSNWNAPGNGETREEKKMPQQNGANDKQEREIDTRRYGSKILGRVQGQRQPPGGNVEKLSYLQNNQQLLSV